MPLKTVAVGRLVKAHGIRGEIAVELWLETGEAVSAGREISLQGLEGDSWRARIEALRPHQDRILLTLEGITDRDLARSLIPADIRIDRDDLPPLQEGEYLWEDLVGLGVVDEKGKSLGRLEEVFSSGPGGENDVIVVRNGNGEILLPMTREVVKDVDLNGGRMTVEVPEGLEDTGTREDDL